MRPSSSKIAIALIILSVALFNITTIREGHTWGDDFCMYILHARNISEGIDYRDTGYIYNPFSPWIGPRIYPPVFPVLLAPVYKLFGLNLKVMKIEIIIFFALSLFIFFIIFRTELSTKYLVAVIAVIGFNPYFWSFKNNILSDIPFLCFVYASLLLIDRAHNSSKSQKQVYLQGIAAGLLIYLSYGIRTLGGVLLLSLLIFVIIRYRKLTHFTLIASFLSVLLMVLQSILFPGIGGYLDQASLSIKTILTNLDQYTLSLFAIWDNGYSKNLALSVIICCLAFIGYLSRVRDRITVFEIFPLLYMMPVMIWPSYQGTRFLIPIIPLYIFYAFVGIEKGIRFVGEKTKEAAFIILVVAIFFSYISKYAKLDYGPIKEGITKKESVELFSYIKEHTRKDDVFIFLKPRALALYTNRRASAYHWPKDKKHLLNYFNKIGAKYFAFFPRHEPYLQGFVSKYNNIFKLIYSNADFKMYSINNLS